MNDVKTDPFNTVEKLLLTFFSGNKVVAFTDIEAFFKRFDSYFSDKRVLHSFLNEIRSLCGGNGKIEVSKIAMFVRDEVDLFPK